MTKPIHPNITTVRKKPDTTKKKCKMQEKDVKFDADKVKFSLKTQTP